MQAITLIEGHTTQIRLRYGADTAEIGRKLGFYTPIHRGYRIPDDYPLL